MGRQSARLKTRRKPTHQNKRPLERPRFADLRIRAQVRKRMAEDMISTEFDGTKGVMEQRQPTREPLKKGGDP
jgi:hypothetical protein